MEVIAWRNHSNNVHPLERFASVATGTALAISGARKGRSGIPRILAGALIMRRGVTGQCELYRALGLRTTPSQSTVPYELGIRARAAVTINQPRGHVYEFWSDLENLPRFMRHLVSVTKLEGTRSHWVAEGPGGRQYQWDAEIINDKPNELILWRSLRGADVDSVGSVRFQDAPGNRGTEIRVELQYNPPAGVAGAYIARLFGREPEQEIAADLRRLKQFLETGEIATTEDQPRGSAVSALNGVERRRVGRMEEVLP